MKDKFPNEKWKKIEIKNLAPHEKYEISNYGRIKSFKVYKDDGLVIKGAAIQGYRILSVRLKNEKFKTIYIHKLVAEYFCAKRNEDSIFVIHVDYKKDNNYYKNLKWTTKKQMELHQKENPSRPYRMITNSKLTEAKVKQIKKILLKDNIKLYQVAAKFGITHTQLNRIRSGENWGYVTLD
ncbi:MAG TPA: NUMOD4 domain-containing protein [Cytophagaceae bacterium]|jgi:hypothetical protein